MDASVAQKLSRRQLLLTGGSAAAALAVTSSQSSVLRGAVALAAAPAVPRYVSRPDLRIPTLTVRPSAAGVAARADPARALQRAAPAQAGALIVDDHGEPSGSSRSRTSSPPTSASRPISGRPALTWWEGYIALGHGVGRYVIADTSYTPIAHVNAGNGHQGDLHEFLITDRGTALLTTYVRDRPRPARGRRQAPTARSRTRCSRRSTSRSGRVLLEWHSLDHIPIEESYWPLAATGTTST